MGWRLICGNPYRRLRLCRTHSRAAQLVLRWKKSHLRKAFRSSHLHSRSPGSVPTELRFFKEEGLEVEVATTPGTAAAMQLVVGKRVDVAMGNPIGAMIAI